MNFDRQSVADCIIPTVPPADSRCLDADFALAHPETCGPALIIKPSVLILCVGESIRFRVYEYDLGVETELTAGITFESTDPSVFTIGVNSGSGTCFAAGLVQIIATHSDGRTVTAHLETNLADACCEEVTVATAIVVDKSHSMRLAKNGATQRLVFAKTIATAYGSLIAEVADVPKDSLKVWELDNAVTALTAFVQTTAPITTAIAGITQTQNKTDLLNVFTTVAADLLEETAERRILFLISDGEHTEDTDIQAILDAATSFKDAGGIVLVVGAWANGAGYDLLERVATGGYFINHTTPTSTATIATLNFLKKLLCAGKCVPEGDEYIYAPAENYSDFLFWEVALAGMVNLLGPGLLDVEPDHGLYVELASGGNKATINTILSYPVTAGLNYSLSFKAAGNQRLNIAGQGIKAYVRAVGANDSDPNIFETTVFPDWDAGFQDYAFSFSPLATASVKLYFEQLGTDANPSAGNLLDDVAFKESSTLSDLLTDGFDTENLTYVMPACGASAPLTEIANAAAPVVTWVGDFSDSIVTHYKYTFGVTYLTLEGETAVASVVFSRDAAAYELTTRSIAIPQPTDARVTSIRLWRSLGEEVGVDPDSSTLFLLAELPVGQTSYLDSESPAAFTARYDNSIQAPTVNTTAVGDGGLGYGFADCCYYHSIPGDAGVALPNLGDEPEFPGFSQYPINDLDGHQHLEDEVDPGFGEMYSYSWQYLTVCGHTTLGSVTSQVSSDDYNATLISWPEPRFLNDRYTGRRLLRLRTDGIGWGIVADLPLDTTEYIDRMSKAEWELVQGAVGVDETNTTDCSTPGTVVFENQCVICADAPPGVQLPDTNPLPNIEDEDYNPPVQFTVTKTYRATCGAGFANLKTTGETHALISNVRTTVAGSDSVIPVMTGPTSPSGEVIASHADVVDNQPFKAFDGDPNTYWIPATGVLAAWIGYKFDVARIVNRYTIQAIELAVGAPKVWTFEGSNDGVTWVVLDTRSIDSPVHWDPLEIKSFTFSNTTAFTRYRVNVTATNGISTQNLNIVGITMGADDVDVITTVVSLAAAVVPGYYKLGGISGFFPKSWHMDGSNDGSTWTVLDTKYSQPSYNGQMRSILITGNTTAYSYYRTVITEFTGTLILAQPPISGNNFLFAATPAFVDASATATRDSLAQATADALAAATALATAQINCVPVFSKTGAAQAICPFNQYGLTVNKSATVFSLVSAQDAQEQADAAALYAAEAERDCTLSNNDQQITINDRAGAAGPVKATPYPSVQYVAGKTGVITAVTVELIGLTHGNPDDIHILLVHPDGVTCVELMANCGGVNDINAVDLTFDQLAGSLPDSTQISSGTFKPTQNGSTGAGFYPTPAPQAAPSTTLAVFNTLAPNGSWSLWIVDDSNLDGGTLSGWSITVTSA